MPLPNEPTSRFLVERLAPHVIRWHIASPHDPVRMEYKEYLRIIYGAFCFRMAELCGEEVKVRVGVRRKGTCNFSLEFRYPRHKFGGEKVPREQVNGTEGTEGTEQGVLDGIGNTFGAFGLELEGEGLVLGEGGM